MRSLHHVLTFAVVTFAATATSVLPTGCGAGDATPGKRVAFDVVVTGSAPVKAGSFTTAYGWNVTLSRALVATGPLTFFDGATIFARRGRAPSGGLLGVRTAYAHPGHYEPGEAKGELLVGATVDLRGESPIGRGAGVSGVYRSGTFSFGAPSGALGAELGGNVALLEGTATRGGDTRAFRAEVRADELRADTGRPEIEGCAFAEASVQGDGRVVVTVKAEQWLDRVDFSDVSVAADGRPAALGAVSRNQLVRGMKSGTPYVFAFTPR